MKKPVAKTKIEAWQEGVLSTSPATDHSFLNRRKTVAPTIIAVQVIAAKSLLGSGSCVQSLNGREHHE
jgi:hypothetical protein